MPISVAYCVKARLWCNAYRSSAIPLASGWRRCRKSKPGGCKTCGSQCGGKRESIAGNPAQRSAIKRRSMLLTAQEAFGVARAQPKTATARGRKCSQRITVHFGVAARRCPKRIESSIRLAKLELADAEPDAGAGVGG